MARGKKDTGIWAAMKSGKFWHELALKAEPKPEPAPEKPKKTKPKSAMAKKILEAKAKKEKDFPNRENTQVKSSKTSGKSQPGCTKRTNISPKKGNLTSSEPEAEKKVDIPFNNPARKSQTFIGSKPGRKIATSGKVLDLDLWEGDTTEIYPKITVMPHGLRLIGTYEEFMRLANRLLSG